MARAETRQTRHKGAHGLRHEYSIWPEVANRIPDKSDGRPKLPL